MAKQVTIGGNRVGSGKKMKAELYNYFRSTHNLSEKFASTMGVGILYPVLVKPAMRGDVFDIGMDMDLRTIPTKGPLFGTFKAQLDIYQIPDRLYQGILHNNPLAIGLNMAQVKFPMLRMKSEVHNYYNGAEFANNSLIKYLGMSGLGTSVTPGGGGVLARYVNALPVLMYYDIYKTYYANKQEEKGYIIGTSVSEKNAGTKDEGEWTLYPQMLENTESSTYGDHLLTPFKKGEGDVIVVAEYENFDEIPEDEELFIYKVYDSNNIIINEERVDKEKLLEWQRIQNNHPSWINVQYNVSITRPIITKQNRRITLTFHPVQDNAANIYILIDEISVGFDKVNEIVIKDFDLSNIDDMRYDLLSHNRLGQTFIIGENDGDEGQYMPYSEIYEVEEANNKSKSCYKLNGLALKTYQNDIFNNWLNTEWIEGENGVNELTKVQVVNGKFSMDALLFATKLYNMLNRVAVSGGTYEDWQDVMYEEVKRKQIESPIYCGGLSKEIVFDEIVQTAPTSVDGDTQALGTLGGRGRASKEYKGGKVHIKCDEACFIIGIMSLTPRQYNTQGNEFYMTDIQTLDDLHKPGMDGIGFQDLIGERMAWFDTALASDMIVNRSKIGKLPAWIEYMTSVNKAYGEFANVESEAGFMILNRNYEKLNGLNGGYAGIKDATTYIDPSKYNYAFAYTKLDAQNFWCEIDFNIKARRLMSARLIPHV